MGDQRTERDAYLRDDVFEEIEIKFVILLGDILFVAGRRLDGAVRRQKIQARTLQQ
jgi:hypothetical protein